MPKLPDKSPLIVYWQFWGNQRPKTYWALVKGEEIQFNALAEARSWAIANGYQGIKTRAWRGEVA